MNVNEMELLHIIRQTDNPEQSLIIAVDTILKFLKQHESSQVQSSACLQEPC